MRLFLLVAMWFLGFLLHEMAFGLLSIFLPLYITGQLGGNLTDVGVMVAAANVVGVPFAFFWGYLCDKTRRYKLYVLVSFSMLSVLLFLLSLTTAIVLLIAVYAVMAVFHVAHEAPKNVLIAESYSRPDWERSFATYEAFTEIGWLSGLILGFALSGFGFGSTALILICSGLNVIAFFASLLLVKDPTLIFERRLVAIEKVVNFAHRGFSLASKALDGQQVKEKLRTENATVFCAGLLLFFLATSMLFTPLPVFFSANLGLAQSLIFGIFMFNTLGGLSGYVLAGRRAQQLNGKAVVQRVNLARAGLSLLLISTAVWFSALTLALAVVVLMLIGITYSLFLISTLSMSMELIPEGKAGLFNALIGLGGAVGCYLGTFIAQNYDFPTLFAAVSIVFLLSYVAFKTYTK